LEALEVWEWEIKVTWKAAILAGLVILGVAKPAFPDSPDLETFQGPEGDYLRIPPGYLWDNSQYNYTLKIPAGVEGCTDGGIMSSHGFAIGPSDMSCLDVFKHHVASFYAGYNLANAESVKKQTLIRNICKTHRVKTTNIVVNGHRFFKCWDQVNNSDGKSRYINYFTFSEPNPCLEFHVYIVCPVSGDCNQWVQKWEKLIFNNLHIHWSR
jgi:hypothetical protein